MNDLLGQTGAQFSECGTFRTSLWRVWDDSLPRAVSCLLNPSKADAIHNDPTVERQLRRALLWTRITGVQIGGIEIVNLFSYRETDSTLLPGLFHSGVDLVGPDNDRAILAAASRAMIFICGWGRHGTLGGRDQEVLRMLEHAGVTPMALGVNGDGTPKHPLYVGYDVVPQRYVSCVVTGAKQ
jgi:hypothetical protein